MSDPQPDPPPFTIRFDWDKAAAHPVGWGYNARPDVPLSGITVHSDEHGRGQTFAAVCRYGRDSKSVSWHYSISDEGEIQRLLDPGPWRAWHAGLSTWRGQPDCNSWCVGVELYHRAGAGLYPGVQLAALTWLVRVLLADHPTITRAGIHAHRWCALPLGRKQDPTDWSDALVRAWIAAL